MVRLGPSVEGGGLVGDVGDEGNDVFVEVDVDIDVDVNVTVVSLLPPSPSGHCSCCGEVAVAAGIDPTLPSE